jgi:hypothetical protein
MSFGRIAGITPGLGNTEYVPGGYELSYPKEYTWGETFKDLAARLTEDLVGERKLPPNKIFFPEVEQKYPGKEDVELARKYQTQYGNPLSGHFEEGSKGRTVSEELAPRVLNGGLYNSVPYVARTKEQADILMQAQIAANRSPIAALGYDPRELLTTPYEKAEFNISGTTESKAPYQIWAHERYPDTIVHEAMHRGLRKMEENGFKLPDDVDEETFVRALKVRYFGDIEKGHGELGDKQVSEGKSALYKGKYSKLIDEMEAKAAGLIARMHPRGPR